MDAYMGCLQESHDSSSVSLVQVVVQNAVKWHTLREKYSKFKKEKMQLSYTLIVLTSSHSSLV